MTASTTGELQMTYSNEDLRTSDTLCVGERVRHSAFPNQRGFIRFVGNVEGVGLRAGVEWDNEDFGKNSGSYKGVQYFSCKGKSGSFVALDKLLSAQPLDKLLIARYHPSKFHSNYGVSGKSPDVRLEDGSFPNVQNCECNGSEILSCVGSCGPKLSDYFSNIKDLSIAFTLVTDWADVFEIASNLRNLSYFNCSDNPLGVVPPLQANARVVTSVKVLKATNTGVTPGCIQHLLAHFPSVTDLCCSGNSLTELKFEEEETSFPNLQCLRLNGNDFVKFSTVALHLPSRFPAVKSLYLSQNPLKEFDCGDIGNLEHLFLRDNHIKELEDAKNLKSFEALKEIAFSSVHHEEMDPRERRYLYLAILPPVKIYNGGQVSQAEREDAERYAVRHYHERDDAPSIIVDLRQRHGNLQPFPNIQMSRHKEIEVTIRTLFSSGHDELKTFRVQKSLITEKAAVAFDRETVNVRWTVRELGTVLQQKLKLPDTRCVHLFHVDRELAENPGAVKKGMHVKEMLYSSDHLHRYRMSPNDEIVVLVTDVENMWTF